MSKLEVIEIFGSRIEAELAKSYLGSMGIKTQIVADDADQLYPSLSAVKGIKLITTSENVEKAKTMLEKKQESPE